ncbi:MAG: exonuclease SbcCD subunit D [Clostridium sp.]
MRFFHISDLHIGKQLNGYSLKENQEVVLSQVIQYAENERPDAILICGDIYDKSVPSGEAYTTFDSFLNRLAELKPTIPVLIIAGNHDSPERLQYAASFLERHKIYIAAMPPKTQDEYLKKVTIADEWGNVNFYLCPFMKPGYVRQLLEVEAAEGYERAFGGLIARETIDSSERNVILTHQFFVNGGNPPETCESEQAVLTSGGLDQIDCSVLDPFDYAALGHIHGPQKVGRETVRYSGTPYKYSVSEEYHKKSITLVTMEKKGEPIGIATLPLAGSLDVRREKGLLNDVIAAGTEQNRHDFISITLTDEEESYDFRERLEEVYDHILDIRIDNSRTRRRIEEDGETIEVLNPLDAFRQFYEAIRRCPMTGEQEQVMMQIIEDAKEEEGR